MNDVRETYEIGMEAHTYLYPLVMMELTRRQSIHIDAGGAPGHGPMNSLTHIREYPTADFRGVVRPNFDTLYSTGWLDLSREPMIVSVPDTHGRYYMLPMLDMWTDVFAVPGTRTTGTNEARFAVVPLGWVGDLPAGIDKIVSPTCFVWIIGRTQTNGPADYAAVHTVQDGFHIAPLSQSGKVVKKPAVEIDSTVDMNAPPLEQLNSMNAARFFPLAAELLMLNAPHVTDQPLIARMKRIGFNAGKSFDFSKQRNDAREALEHAVKDSLLRLHEKSDSFGRHVNGWLINTESVGVYGNNYLQRAIIAMKGLGANLPDDAVYPLCVADANGIPLDGANDYVLHFNKQDVPPVEAFWSVTMYDEEGYQVKNSINRFAIGDRDDLKWNSDGSLDLYIQHDSPGKAHESNWLPAPLGRLGITMRCYAPKAEIRDGSWAPPPIQRAAHRRAVA